MICPIIETERLRLRMLCEDDFSALATFLGDPDQARFIGGPCDRETAWRKMASMAGHWLLRGYGMFAVETRDETGFIGVVGPWKPEGWPELEVGWWILPHAQGHGYAYEAADRARAFAYEATGADTIVSYIHPDNAPSQSVARRLGAKTETLIDLGGRLSEVWRHPPRAVGSAPGPEQAA